MADVHCLSVRVVAESTSQALRSTSFSRTGWNLSASVNHLIRCLPCPITGMYCMSPLHGPRAARAPRRGAAVSPPALRPEPLRSAARLPPGRQTHPQDRKTELRSAQWGQRLEPGITPSSPAPRAAFNRINRDLNAER
ncbi:hypothetical protein NDU88_004197 [Pleurodeles waltl]|uniref:Uncharacterized protein n=1 Tax=Pleurodeles waltl TaxID=8319 RepID=A0AAV7T838_PLEWA|nr:hypothetical protein NDU88_004197 [Pleurodeles waltl]